MRIVVYNIKYKEKVSAINVCGYEALADWLYRKDVAKVPTAVNSNSAPKEIEVNLTGFTPETLLGERYEEGRKYIIQRIEKETGLEVEDFDLKIPNQYLYRR